MIIQTTPLFVHSDVSRVRHAAKRAGAKLQSGQVQASLVDFLACQTGLGEDGLLFPAFNYDYGGTRVFDVNNSEVQVGVLPEWLRRQGQFQRSEVPFLPFFSKVDLDP